MSFSFGFTDENFSDDELVETELTGTNLNQNQTSTTNRSQNPLDLIDSVEDNDKRAPKLEDFESLVRSLKDVRVTFEKYITPGGNVVYRRELYDVKHQLMSEDDVENQQNNEDEFSILIGNNATDLKKNVYEGGLKSWECSIDTVDKLSLQDDTSLLQGDVLELGCGTALPSTYLFNRLLKSGSTDKTFVLSDYNSLVLRLVTIPNLIVTWASNLPQEELTSLQLSGNEEIPIVEEELQLTNALLEKFLESLSLKRITFKLLSGAWGRQFVNLLSSLNTQYRYIITSETIYSPETLPIIGELLIELVTTSKGSIGIVSAKDIYFGVGGSIVEFVNFLEQRQKQGAPISFRTEKINAGLKRSIVFIESN